MRSSNCPKPLELSDFALGRLRVDLLDRVANHIDACPDCATVVSLAADDSDMIIAALKDLPHEQKYGDELKFQEAIARAEKIERQFSSDEPELPTRDSADDPPREFVRDFELLEKIGAGGMGVVYKARHTKLNRIVALKLLPASGFQHPEVVQRFTREIEALGKLAHPNIVGALRREQSLRTHSRSGEPYIAHDDDFQWVFVQDPAQPRWQEPKRYYITNLKTGRVLSESDTGEVVDRVRHEDIGNGHGLRPEELSRDGSTKHAVTTQQWEAHWEPNIALAVCRFKNRETGNWLSHSPKNRRISGLTDKDRLMVSYPSRGINPSGNVKGSEQLTDALLIMLSIPNEVRGVSWKEAQAILEKDDVDSVFQSHSLNVTINMSTGERYRTTEPKIGAVREVLDKCGKLDRVNFATE